GHFDRSPGSSIIRRDVFEKEGGFIVPKYAGDTELWFRLGQKYDLVLFQRDLVWERCHTETESNYEKKDKEIRILRKRIVSDMLNSPFCPLEDHHIQRFKQNKRSKKIFIFLKRVLKF
ncbi:MAG: hypothetical protein ORN53_05195, partial [Crocinitomicaceae bacterium]|nr:hypothetical protein [Crocinitomicaceae bacterium]